MSKYVVVKRTGYERPIWQVIVRATGGVVTTHATRSAAIKAARVIWEGPVSVERDVHRLRRSSSAAPSSWLFSDYLGLKVYGPLDDDPRVRP